MGVRSAGTGQRTQELKCSQAQKCGVGRRVGSRAGEERQVGASGQERHRGGWGAWLFQVGMRQVEDGEVAVALGFQTLGNGSRWQQLLRLSCSWILPALDRPDAQPPGALPEVARATWSGPVLLGCTGLPPGVMGRLSAVVVQQVALGTVALGFWARWLLQIPSVRGDMRPK